MIVTVPGASITFTTEPPVGTLGTIPYCPGDSISDGILVWVNNDSGWVPTSVTSTPWCILQSGISIGGETFTLSFYRTWPLTNYATDFGGASPGSDLKLLFTASPLWTTGSIVQKTFKLYVAQYKRYWVDNGGVWNLCSSPWDAQPGSCGGVGNAVYLSCHLAAVPMTTDGADAAIDNRPICADNPALGLEYPKFGAYKYLGGLFAGQAPAYYGSKRTQTQNNPDLSATGRTLLRFKKSDGLPTTVHSACVALFYRATPYYVWYEKAQDDLDYALGLYSVPGAVQSFTESTVTWEALKGIIPYDPPGGLTSSEYRGGTAEFGNQDTRLRNSDYNGNYANNQLVMRPERETPPWLPVTVPMTLTAWSPNGNELPLLLAIYLEQINVSETTRCWYYFNGKESGALAQYLPRLWVAW